VALPVTLLPPAPQVPAGSRSHRRVDVGNVALGGIEDIEQAFAARALLDLPHPIYLALELLDGEIEILCSARIWLAYLAHTGSSLSIWLTISRKGGSEGVGGVGPPDERMPHERGRGPFFRPAA
jgi:hypothetical protein